MKTSIMVPGVLAASLLGSQLRADTDITCVKSSGFLAPAAGESPRHYAPDREVQTLHLALDITPDFKRRTFEATAVLRFKPVAKPVQEVKLNAVELNFHSVTATEPLQAYQVTEDHIILTFAQPLPIDREVSVTFAYSAEPTEGIYFRTPELGYPPGDAHLFSQGEEIEARHWYPCVDSPNQRFTSEITCRLPEGMTAISNGRLVSETKDPATGLVAFHWAQEKTHVSYLVSLVAGYFKKLEEDFHGLPLSFYTPPSEFAEATNSFRDTRDMMAFYEQEIGVPYPWPKYSQTCVQDFVAGGMENTSATTLTDGTLFTPATENIRSSEGLIAHELAHQWFGDLVTCKDWSHIWLNEGFATFYETLYNAHKNGRDAMLYSIYQRARQITRMTNDFKPIVRRTYGEPRDMFDYLVYPKAGWVLRMIRAELGDDLYRRCIKTYLERHAYGNVTTEDLRAVIEELSGRSFDQFFDQWLYHGHFPELELAYAWDETARLARISVHQVQPIGPEVLLFNFPLTFRFHGKGGATNCTVQIKQKEEDFYFALPAAPDIVRADPDYTLLARTKFTLPKPMLFAQVADHEDPVGRLLAIEQLADQRDQETVAKLKQTLNQDPFFGVRIEAAGALRSIHTDDALTALLDSTKQSDARVRRAVVEGIGGFYADSAASWAKRTLGTEKNPDILALALRSIAGYAKPDNGPLFLQFLEARSFRNELADADILALRSQDDPTYITPLLENLKKRDPDFTRRGFGQALETLGYLARNEEKKDAVRDFIIARLDQPNRTVKLAAIRALGQLGDPQAIAVLEKLASAAKTTPEQSAAEQAVATLRAGRKPVDDFKNLRQEVLELEKTTRELQKRMDEMKAKSAAAPPGKGKTRGK